MPNLHSRPCSPLLSRPRHDSYNVQLSRLACPPLPHSTRGLCAAGSAGIRRSPATFDSRRRESPADLAAGTSEKEVGAHSGSRGLPLLHTMLVRFFLVGTWYELGCSRYVNTRVCAVLITAGNLPPPRGDQR